MKNIWNDENITKALKDAGPLPLDEHVSNRVWYKIAEKIEAKQNPSRHHVVWRPWSHPVRWIGVAACFGLVWMGLVQYRDSVETAELTSYILNVSNAPESVTTQDLGVVRVSVLLSEPSSVSLIDVKDEDRVNPLAADDILL